MEIQACPKTDELRGCLDLFLSDCEIDFDFLGTSSTFKSDASDDLFAPSLRLRHFPGIPLQRVGREGCNLDPE